MKISRVQYIGQHTVYDVSVKDNKSYVTENGLINHNTTASDIKQMFIAPEGYYILEVDYSQAELRVVAELAEEDVMIDIFKRGYNIHVATACKTNGCLDRYDEIRKILKDENHPDWLFWEKEKKRAKLINFGILYGQTAKKLSGELSDAMGREVTFAEADKFIEEWYKTYPKIKAWIRRQQGIARTEGEVKNIFGRVRRLPNAQFTDREAKASGLWGGIILKPYDNRSMRPSRGPARTLHSSHRYLSVKKY